MNFPFQTKKQLSAKNATFIFINIHNHRNVYIIFHKLLFEFQRAEWCLRQDICSEHLHHLQIQDLGLAFFIIYSSPLSTVLHVLLV